MITSPFTVIQITLSFTLIGSAKNGSVKVNFFTTERLVLSKQQIIIEL